MLLQSFLFEYQGENGANYISRCDEFAALISGVTFLVTFFERCFGVVPTARATVIGNYPVGGAEFMPGICEAANHHYGNSRSPGQPAQSAG